MKKLEMKISAKVLKNRLIGLRIDADNMAEDMRQTRDAWPERFDEVERLRLKELRSMSAKMNRLINRI